MTIWLPLGVAGRQPPVRHEEGEPRHHEVQQRLGEESANPHTNYFGLYQMGDVNARSWVVIGTFGSVILILK